MKKLVLILVAILSITFVGACQTTVEEELKLDTPYEYTGVTFVRPERITLEQAKAMIPASSAILAGVTINTIDDVENCIAQNLDKYNVHKNEGGIIIVEMYMPIFQEVTISEDVIVLKGEEEGQNIQLSYEKNGNEYTVANEGISLSLTFEEGVIYYEKELLIEGYFIRYNHQIKK